MLVLSSAVDDVVEISVPPSTEPTTIRVVAVEIRPRGRRQVRIGYEAPREVEILRGDAKKRSKEPAA